MGKDAWEFYFGTEAGTKLYYSDVSNDGWQGVMEFAEAYASSRLAVVTQQYTEKVDQCISLSDRDYWKNKAEAAESRLAEVTAQLAAERKEYEKEIDRLQSVCVLAEKERDALAKPVDGMSDSNYEAGQNLWREWFEGGDRKPPEIPADTSLMLTWIVAKFRAKLHSFAEAYASSCLAAQQQNLYQAYLLGCEDECIPEPKTLEQFIEIWRDK